MTDFEKAQIRLRAWEALVGWGVKKDDKQELWNWDERLKFATVLADWAASEQHSSDA